MSEEKTVSADNKKLARFIAGAIGIEPHVLRYWDEDNKNYLDIVNLVDPIDKNVKFCSTIGLSDFPNLIETDDNQKKNIPIELLITTYNRYENAPNILSTCAFYISKNKWTCQPNDVFKNLVEMYYPQKEIKHIFFDTPFLWEDKLNDGLELDTKKVRFLLCIPITDKELKFKLEHGTDALRDLFSEKEIDIFDFDRESVV